MSGMIAAPIIGNLIDRTRKYIVVLRALSLLLSIALCFCLYCIQHKEFFNLTLVTMIVSGGCAVSMVPTYLDLANELTFPM